jgi:hypothetical protein
MESAVFPGGAALPAAPQIIVMMASAEHKILWKSPQKTLYLDPFFDYNIGARMEARFSDSQAFINLIFSMR